MNQRKIIRLLVDIDSMAAEIVQRVGRAVRNLEQEMSGGFGSRSVGSGEPGGGSGGMTMTIAGDRVPVSPVELAVFAGEDRAAHDRQSVLGHLEAANRIAAQMLEPLDLALPPLPASPTPIQRAAYLAAQAIRLTERDFAHAADLDDADVTDLIRCVYAAHRQVSNWGYKTGRAPKPSREQRERLAIDRTEMWCTSHLRVGAKRDRHRGELCQWCDRFERNEGFVPPVDLVELHVDNGKVYDHQVELHRRRHRDRERNRP